jgi:predicted nucleotidyltransferase
MQLCALQQRTIDDLCRRYRIRTLRLFGSAAVGRETAASDVDLLVDSTPGQVPGAFERVDLLDALPQVFEGRPVDLAFVGILDNPYRRQAIEPQLRPLLPAAAGA